MREESCQVPAKASETEGQVLLEENPSEHKQALGKIRECVKLYSLEGGQSRGGGIQQRHNLAQTRILVSAYDISQ
jgi:hypothetical protein